MIIFDKDMRMISKIFIAILICLSTVQCSALMEDGSISSYEKATLVRVGDSAPDFTVDMLSGQTLTLSKLQGQRVLLTFFETKSPDSRKELALLELVQKQLSEYKCTLLLIASGEEKRTVEDFIEQHGYTFDVGIDTDKSIFSLYATKYLPRTIVLDALGRIVAISSDYDQEELEVLIEIISKL